MEVYKRFKWEFLQMAAQDRDPALVASMNRRTLDREIDDILWFQLVMFVCNSFSGGSLQKANKVVWTCADGRLEHRVLVREA